MILESALVRLYGDKGFAAYELLPLKRSDVREAAQQSGISTPDAFLERIEALAVTPLAIKPVTLNILINTYLRDGSLPSNQIELLAGIAKIPGGRNAPACRSMKPRNSLPGRPQVSRQMGTPSRVTY
jgi:hypothetical protein